MYNLLVSGNDESWQGKPWDIELPRAVREYTDDKIKERYKSLDEDAVAALMKFPAVFAYEDPKLSARIGWMTRVRARNRTVRVEYEIEKALPKLSPDIFRKFEFDLDIGKWEMGRTHWAVKDVDLFPTLIEIGALDKDDVYDQPRKSRIVTLGLGQPEATKIDARPTVFRIPEGRRDPKLVAVMMPFSAQFNAAYDALADACDSVKLVSDRADEIWEESEVMQDVFSLIYRSEFVICDFSGKNPNVFYEAGIAHTLGRTVIPISQSHDDVPFDLRHHRYVHYLNNAEGRRKLADMVAKRLSTLMRR